MAVSRFQAFFSPAAGNTGRWATFIFEDKMMGKQMSSSSERPNILMDMG